MTVLEPHRVGVPLPNPSTVSKPFWEGCASGELRYQRCGACGGAVFNPSPRCRNCASDDLGWEVSGGLGAVYSHSTVWRPAGPEFASPYVVAIVDVDEGFQILANVIGCTPDDVHAGQRLVVEFHPIGGDYHLPYFRPA